MVRLDGENCATKTPRIVISYIGLSVACIFSFLLQPIRSLWMIRFSNTLTRTAKRNGFWFFHNCMQAITSVLGFSETLRFMLKKAYQEASNVTEDATLSSDNLIRMQKSCLAKLHHLTWCHRVGRKWRCKNNNNVAVGWQRDFLNFHSVEISRTAFEEVHPTPPCPSLLLAFSHGCVSGFLGLRREMKKK